MKKDKGPAKAQEGKAASPVICVMRMGEADGGTLAQSVKEAMGTMEGIAADSGMEGCGVICVLHMGPEGGDAAGLIAEAVGAADALDAAEALEAAVEGDGDAEAAGAEGTDIPDDMEITDMAMRHVQGAIKEVRAACGAYPDHLDLEKASEVLRLLECAGNGLRRHAEGLLPERLGGAGAGADEGQDAAGGTEDGGGMDDCLLDIMAMEALEKHIALIREEVEGAYGWHCPTWRGKRILKKLGKLEDEVSAHARDLHAVWQVWDHVLAGKMPPEALEIAKGSKGFKERMKE